MTAPGVSLDSRADRSRDLHAELADFRAHGKRTVVTSLGDVPVYVGEFWTSKQRAACSLHEVSYRACFKPQLPRFFIERLTAPGDRVHDPFLGRGTTALEAALLGRAPGGADVNPLSRMLLEPRLRPPRSEDVAIRLAELDLSWSGVLPEELLVFYSPGTLAHICALRQYLIQGEREGRLDAVDRWIRMVAVNRLTGHSPGFFSVYTMPPNQAVSATAQAKINARRGQTPPDADVPKLILKKTRSLLRGVDDEMRERLASVAGDARILVAPAAGTHALEASSIQLVVTSPPFLDVVNYAADNWLRCWFCDIDPSGVEITMARTVETWQVAMQAALAEQARLLCSGGHIAFEVGEVRGGKVRLEEAVLPAGRAAGLAPELVLINDQNFTKTANCWGVDNNAKGTNTNRIVLFRCP